MQTATAPALQIGLQHTLGRLPASVERAMWRGSELGSRLDPVQPTGWDSLDQELPGGGWPTRSVTEVLTAQPAVLEWRLLGHALKVMTSKGAQVVAVGTPRAPHLPGLLHEGLSERQFIWIQADAPAERLWVTEQLIKSNAVGAVLAWLPQARQEQIRRLQVCAQGFEGLAILFRASAARREASAAPLRLSATVGLDWELQVEVFKRRGPAHEGQVLLPSIPGGLSPVLTPRLMKPSVLINREAPDVVGRPAVTSRQRATA
ncbi:translesion DNA synthesis-associated protein ImuA [Aquabacterium soli]|nr:translesion DNA synthesis-associated protein ImuA [Aquabacterium soli]